MSRAVRRVVMDASAAIQLFVAEKHSDAVTQIFTLAGNEPSLSIHVPDLFYIECTNVLINASKRARRAPQDTEADVADLRKLALTTTSNADLIEIAFSLAWATQLTAYAACYLALAKSVKGPLITADQELLALNGYEGIEVLKPTEFLEKTGPISVP